MNENTKDRIALVVLMDLHPQIKPIERLLQGDKIPNEMMEYFFFSKILKDKFSLYSFAEQYNSWHDAIHKKFVNLGSIKDNFDLIFGYQEILQESLRIPYLGSKPHQTYENMQSFKNTKDIETNNMIAFISNRFLQCINIQKELEASNKKEFTKNTAWAVVFFQFLYSEDITKINVKQYPIDFMQKIKKLQDSISEDIASQYLTATGENISSLFSRIERKFKYDCMNEHVAESSDASEKNNWFDNVKNKIKRKI